MTYEKRGQILLAYNSHALRTIRDFTYALEGIIVEPGPAKPHLGYWNERTNRTKVLQISPKLIVQLQALTAKHCASQLVALLIRPFPLDIFCRRCLVLTYWNLDVNAAIIFFNDVGECDPPVRLVARLFSQKVWAAESYTKYRINYADAFKFLGRQICHEDINNKDGL